MRTLLADADDYVLGRIDSSQLPMIAAQALARGLDTPALGELAGLGNTEVREAADLFAIAMTELGHPLRAAEAVLWDRAAQAATALLDGTREVDDAAGEIARLLCRAHHCRPDGSDDELATDFELLLIDWDEQPSRRDAITVQVEQACRRLLEIAQQLGTSHV